MAQLCCTGGIIQCTFGTATSTFTSTTIKVKVASMQAGTIMDHAPTANIAPFVLCTTPSNPTVAAATAAAQGVLTPMPCIPVTTSPWAPGSPTIKIEGKVALNNTSTCACTWGGTISFSQPGQMICTIP
jgi:hypothetical protein